jgi:hypothetical protein
MDEFTARVNASAFLMDIDIPKVKHKGGKHRLTKKAESMSPAILASLLHLLEGDYALVWIGKVAYCFKGTDQNCSIVALDDGAEHTVMDGKCSCEDARFRNRDCKHIKALRKVVG